MTPGRPLRDPGRELALLRDAVADLGAGDLAFVDHALQRLTDEHDLDDDALAQLGFEPLLSALEDRAADIGACGVLALEALDAESDLSEPMREHLRIVVHVSIALGAYSYQAMTIARLDLAEKGQRS